MIRDARVARIADVKIAAAVQGNCCDGLGIVRGFYKSLRPEKFRICSVDGARQHGYICRGAEADDDVARLEADVHGFSDGGEDVFHCHVRFNHEAGDVGDGFLKLDEVKDG